MPNLNCLISKGIAILLKLFKKLYLNGVNGVLADEMGLGKTIQCVSFVSDLVCVGATGPFLVCGPLSTLLNWMDEFKKFAPAVSFGLVPLVTRRDERVSFCRKSIQ